MKLQLAALLAGMTMAATVTAAPAQADEFSDYAYIKTLDTFGIDYQGNTEVAIEVGHAICQDLDNGFRVDAIAQNGINAGYSPRDTYVIIEAAIGAYCNQYAYLVTG